VPHDRHGANRRADVQHRGARRLTGASYRQLNYWLKLGHLPDDRRAAYRTSGHAVTFTQTELDIVRLVVHLLRVGFVLDRAFAIARQLVTDDEYRAEFADIFQLQISVRDTAADTPPEGEPA
jgi:DNA-binding transcriptional MerR regulator